MKDDMRIFLTAASLFFLSLPASALVVKNEQVILEKLDDYEMCQTRDYNGQFCHDALVRWVSGHPGDAFKAGKMTRLHMNHWVAIPFFDQAFEQKSGNCKDEDVKLAVLSALGQSPKSDVVTKAKRIAFQFCFNELKDAILDGIGDTNTFKNVCKELAAKKLISGLKLNRCSEAK